MANRTELNASDLFVVLERAFRRRARDCAGCTFTMPFSQRTPHGGREDWSIALTNACSPRCHAILEEIVNRYRGEYALAA
jgi:hypothetical protein